MSFTACNVPLWSGNGYELTNGISLNSLGGGNTKMTLIKSEIMPGGNPTTYIMSNIPTYNHLYLYIDTLKPTTTTAGYLLISDDNGISYGSSNAFIVGQTTSTQQNKAYIYNAGYSNTPKYIDTHTTYSTNVVSFDKIYIENSKIGITNCIKLYDSGGITALGTAYLFGQN